MSYARCLLCMPAVAEESGLLASDIGPRRRPIFCLHALFTVASELMLGTIRRCGRSGILAAHFTFVPRPIRLVTRATLYIYGGRGFGFFLLLFHARAVVILAALLTLRTLWSSVLVPASRCRLEAQPLSPHQLRIIAR